MKSMKTGDYSSGMLIQLILTSLERQEILKQLPKNLRDLQALSDPHIQLSLKRQLLAEVYQNWGAVPILKAGFDIQRMADSPLSFTLFKAASVPELLERFFKFQRYFHSKHRVELRGREGNSVALWHMSKTAKKPEIFEDILIAGLLAGMLSLYGCRRVTLKIGGCLAIKNGTVVEDYKPSADCSRFAISWDSVVTPIRYTSAEMKNGFRNFTATGRGRISGKIGEIVENDPIQKWKLKEIACNFGLSPRTLQRRLREEGTTFGDCLLAARCQCAVYYITQKVGSLTAVGFLSGFSDAAHFSREFKRNMGILPSDFQESFSAKG